MTKAIYFAAGIAALAIATSPSMASAACVKPVGQYTGSGSGMSYFTDGNMAQAAAISLSVNLFKDGSGTASEIGKNYSSGPYSFSWNVAAANNYFNTSTCQGTLTTSFGKRYTYTSSMGGKVITFIYTTNDNIFAMYSLRLEKV